MGSKDKTLIVKHFVWKEMKYDLLGHLIAETNQSGTMLAEYVYLGDQLLAMIKPENLVYYFHNDHLGTPQVLTNDSQAIAWKAAYTPFGEAVPSIQTVENPFRFPGQYYDSETGLHYNYFRYYDPTTGRYITPDPIGLEGGINLFSYVSNNPVNRVDPFGLRQVVVGWRPGPNGQPVHMVYDTETGRTTIGFPDTYTDPFTAFLKDALSKGAMAVDKFFDNPCSNEATKAAPLPPTGTALDPAILAFDIYSFIKGLYPQYIRPWLMEPLIRK